MVVSVSHKQYQHTHRRTVQQQAGLDRYILHQALDTWSISGGYCRILFFGCDKAGKRSQSACVGNRLCEEASHVRVVISFSWEDQGFLLGEIGAP